MECFKVLGQPLSIYSDDEGALNSKKLQTFFKEGRYNTRNNKDARKSGRKDDTHSKENDWGQTEALQNENMGGSAKAIIE